MLIQTLETVNLYDCLPVISQGDRGLEVAILQRFLVFYGYLPDNAVNSIFDCETEIAVRQFQQDNGLFQNGIVGVDTWKLLADTMS